MSYIYKLTTEKCLKYLQSELDFIDKNYNFPESIKKKASFFAHISYWQGVFKLYRNLEIKNKTKTNNQPFYIHKDRIELEITTKCSMRCYHCDRSCRQAPSEEYMTLDQLKYFIDESIKTDRKWPFVVLIGGEPTLHPNIYEVAELVVDYKRKHSPNTKITISTNGVTNETKEVLANLPKIIHQENSSKVSKANSQFCAFNIAPVDREENIKAGTDFSIGCKTVTTSGMALTRYGYYTCGAAASVDRVLGLNIGIKNLRDITEQKFREQTGLLCGYCGLFGSKIMSSEELTVVSPTWQKIYADYAKQKPELTLYGDLVSAVIK